MEIINQLHGHMDFESVSKYYDILSYNKLIGFLQSEKLNIIHLNSRSLQKNSDNIQALLKSLHIQPDIWLSLIPGSQTIINTWMNLQDTNHTI